MRLFGLILLVILTSCGSSKQPAATKGKTGPREQGESEKPDPYLRDEIRIVFYNVENYFDIEDDSLTHDEEFTPEGFKHWSFGKMVDKQRKISEVIYDIGKWELPGLLGLCEVENRGVLDNLIKYTPLGESSYKIIHKESPDWRGIDVAVFYRPEVFTPLDTTYIKVVFPFDKSKTTRDILYVKGLIKQIDTLHFFVNHWPSRYGGQQASEPKRLHVASLVKNKVDSILNKNPNAKIIITGDFNDEPSNKSIIEILNAKPDTNELNGRNGLVNLMYNMKEKKGLGSYKYRFEWNMLDQFIVSKALLNTNQPIFTRPEEVIIFKRDYLMQEDDKYPGKKPFRTYLGPRYLGGYSDHFPVYLDLILNKN